MADSKGGYEDKTVDELHKMARDAGISGISNMRKDELIKALESHGRGRGQGSRGGNN